MAAVNIDYIKRYRRNGRNEFSDFFFNCLQRFCVLLMDIHWKSHKSESEER